MNSSRFPLGLTTYPTTGSCRIAAHMNPHQVSKHPPVPSKHKSNKVQSMGGVRAHGHGMEGVGTKC